jgi:hypothetical protein
VGILTKEQNMKTTLRKIREHSPCREGWEKLLRSLGKTQADDEPLSIATVVESNGLDDALWCLRAVRGHDKELRLYAVWCARQVQHLMTDRRSLEALDVAEAYTHGNATVAELGAAWDAAWAAARDAAWDAAWDARVAARAAAWTAKDEAWAAARAASSSSSKRSSKGDSSMGRTGTRAFASLCLKSFL